MGWLAPRTRGRADGKVVSGKVASVLARADLAVHDETVTEPLTQRAPVLRDFTRSDASAPPSPRPSYPAC